MKIDGGCHCGFIAYEGETDPEHVIVCHCTDCQTLSGTAFRTITPISEATFRLTSGKPTIYVKMAESGNEREQAFCPRCGSPIYSSTVGDGPKDYYVRVGTVRQRDQLVPKGQIWSRSAQRWLGHLDMIPRAERQESLERS